MGVNENTRFKWNCERNEQSEASQTTLSSLPFCAGVQFSRDSMRAFNNGIKIRENGGL